MGNSNYSILIVEDETENSVIRRLAESSTFNDVRYCSGAVNAVQEIESRSADVVISELEMADIGGLELAQMVREADKEIQRYTYLIIISRHPLNEGLTDAFDEKVDAFFTLDEISLKLLPAMIAGSRLASKMTKLLAENRELNKITAKLKETQLVDNVTNLGNRKFALQSLNDTIKQIEARGGAVCYLVIGIENFNEVSGKYDKAIADEFVAAVSAKIKSLVRPLDVVTYLENGLFGIVLLQPSIHHCTEKSYQRIFDGVSLKAYKTRIGFIDARVGMSLCASEAETGPPKAVVISGEAEGNLHQSYASGRIFVKHLTS